MRDSKTIRERLRDAVRSGRLLRHSLPNVLRDLRYGGYLGGFVASPWREEGVFASESNDWATLRTLFSHFPLAVPRMDDVIVDIGCGKGRALAYLHQATRGRARVVGIEINPAVGALAAARFRGVGRVEVHIGDGTELFPNDVSLIYLSNPFDVPYAERLARRLVERATRLQDLRIVYHNCTADFTEPFLRRGWRITHYPLSHVAMGSALLWRPEAERITG